MLKKSVLIVLLFLSCINFFVDVVAMEDQTSQLRVVTVASSQAIACRATEQQSTIGKNQWLLYDKSTGNGVIFETDLFVMCNDEGSKKDIQDLVQKRCLPGSDTDLQALQKNVTEELITQRDAEFKARLLEKANKYVGAAFFCSVDIEKHCLGCDLSVEALNRLLTVLQAARQSRQIWQMSDSLPRKETEESKRLINIDVLMDKFSLEELVACINFIDNACIHFGPHYYSLNCSGPIIYRFFDNISARLCKDAIALLAIAQHALSDLTQKNKCILLDDVELEFHNYKQNKKNYAVLSGLSNHAGFGPCTRTGVVSLHFNEIARLLDAIDKEQAQWIRVDIGYPVSCKVNQVAPTEWVFCVEEYVADMIAKRKLRDAGISINEQGEKNPEVQKTIVVTVAVLPQEKADREKEEQVKHELAEKEASKQTEQKVLALKSKQCKEDTKKSKLLAESKSTEQPNSLNAPQKGMPWRTIIALLVAGGGIYLLWQYLMQQKTLV